MSPRRTTDTSCANPIQRAVLGLSSWTATAQAEVPQHAAAPFAEHGTAIQDDS